MNRVVQNRGRPSLLSVMSVNRVNTPLLPCRFFWCGLILGSIILIV